MMHQGRDMSQRRVLIYVLRRDLRIADNPIFHHASLAYTGEGTKSSSKNDDASFTHMLPLYIFHPGQVEVSGFLSSSATSSPFPEARSRLGGFWRTGKRRTKFLAETLWDLRQKLQNRGSNLELRIGHSRDIIGSIVSSLRKDGFAVSLWLTKDWAAEELGEERGILEGYRKAGGSSVDIKVWDDESYLIDR
jgi:deoxyribodipyrimidine photo-lyase